MTFLKLFTEGENVGWLPYNKIVKKDKKGNLKPLWDDLKRSFSIMDLNNYFYFTGSYNFSNPKSQYLIKISTNADINSKQLAPNLKSLKSLKKRGDNTSVNYEVKVKFQITGGNRGSGVLKYDGDTTKNPSNNQQELATIYAIMNPKSTIQDINAAIDFQFDDSWANHFQESKKLKDTKYITNKTIIEHDTTSSFASRLFKGIKKLGYTDSKDNWNPSDFWILNDTPNNILKYLEESKSISQFNDRMKELFNKNKLVGVSLKKINKTAKINIVDPTNREPKNFTLKSIDYKYGQENFFIETKEGFRVRVGKTAKSGSKSIYYEGRMKGSKVQLGGISRAQLVKAFNEHGYDILSWEKDPNLTKPDILEMHVQALKYIIKKDKDFLTDLYYLAMKQSKESSIYLKLH
jgi:hypothetical protein